jgi:uncharacterized protein (DUF2267 family)
MPALGLKIIDNAAQSANVWVNEVDYRTDWGNKQRSYRLLRQVLHVIRDHLSVDEAAQLGAQLPMLIRGIYYDGWNPSASQATLRDPTAFVEKVQEAFSADPMEDAAKAIAAVIDVLDAHVSEGEMEDVKNTFSKKIRALL